MRKMRRPVGRTTLGLTDEARLSRSLSAVVSTRRVRDDILSTLGDWSTTAGEELVVSDSDALLLRYRLAPDADATIVQVTGEIDLSTSNTFEDAVSHALSGLTSVVVVDLQYVTFMGSVGLSALVKANAEAARAQRFLRIADGTAAA